jgi:hypothetical protein
MPNHCYNSLKITGITHDQWRELAATFQVPGEDSQPNFLRTFYPEPDYSITPVSREFPRIHARFAKSEEEREQILKNEPTIREDSWYDWRNLHWGTKWDVYDCTNDWKNEVPSVQFSAGFSTAWSPLSEECMAVLSEKFPGSYLTNFYQEDGFDFCGITVAIDGFVRNITGSVSKYREDFVRAKFPDLDARLEEKGLNLEDDLYDFFWDNCDLDEFNDWLLDSLKSSTINEMMVHAKALTDSPYALRQIENLLQHCI